MSRPVWRTATDTPSYEADDLSGAGAKATGGRWNSPGVPVVYASQTRALACLGTHFGAGGLSLNRTLVQLDIPDAIWADARVENSAILPAGRDAEPAGRASIAFGPAWIRVVHPPHRAVRDRPGGVQRADQSPAPDSAQISAAKLRRWLYDPRLARSV